MKNLGKSISDLIVFTIIFLISYGTLYLFEEVIRSIPKLIEEKISIALLFILTVYYCYKRNKKDKTSIIYGLVVGFALLSALDTRGTKILGILGLVFIISLIYYFIKQKIYENSKTDNNKELDIWNFSKIGGLEKVIEIDSFNINKEIDLERNYYKTYKPKLIQKNLDTDKNIILDFSNKEDLNFTIVINKHKAVSIKHKKKLKDSYKINKNILEGLKTFANNG